MTIVSALLLSCTKEQPLDPGAVDGKPTEGLILKLSPIDMGALTKADATRPGDYDGSFNENNLGNAVDIFFFRPSADENTPSVYNKRASVNARGYVQMSITAADIATIFGSNVVNSQAKVMVIANYNGPESINHSSHYTLKQLKELQLATATWKSKLPANNDKFVMVSYNKETDSPLVPIKLTAPNSSTPAEADVDMKRVAAKVSFRLTVADSIVVVNIVRDQSGNITDRVLETWKPNKMAMTAYLQYAFKVGYLGGEPQTPPETVPMSKIPDSHETLFAYEARNLKATSEKIMRKRKPVTGLDTSVDPPQPIYGEEKQSEFPVYAVMSNPESDVAGPFYTYPVTWTPGAAGEPFIKLVIPWNNGSRTKYYYYKVPFKGAPLESNHWYEVTLDVQILGGEDTQPVPLEANYKVVDWVSGAETEATIESARYLSVPKTEWIMYNTDELTIPITSSHDVQIVGYEVKTGGTAKGNAFAAADKYTNDLPRAEAWIGTDPSIYNPFTDTRFTIAETTTVGTIYATKPNFNDNTLGTPRPNNINATSWFPAAEVTRKQIVLRHPLKNDFSTSDYDVAPYWIRIRVQHKDASDTYYRDIIIEQRPAIYIEPNQNPDNGSTNYAGANKGYVYIDNEQSTNYNNWKYVRGLAGSNKNVNMYVINVSVLEASSDYILGDPRTLEVDNLNYQFRSATSVQGGQRRLQNYYPTQTTDAYKNMIAPKLRVASSYGVCYEGMSFQEAQRRCASYQEAGYPAGRWRVPTRAEVEFITTLSSQEVIPILFNIGSQYWSATGAVSPQPSGKLNDVTSNNTFVRCVYDEWFWENTTHATVDKNTFTWGDQTRESVVRTKAQQ